jgi:hypothetical protein
MAKRVIRARESAKISRRRSIRSLALNGDFKAKNDIGPSLLGKKFRLLDQKPRLPSSYSVGL